MERYILSTIHYSFSKKLKQKFEDKVNLQENLLGYIYQQSTTAKIVPVDIESILQELTVISITVYLISEN